MGEHYVPIILDFENFVPVAVGWWVYGLILTISLSITAVLSVLSISIFLDVSLRSPTNVLLATVTAVDLLVCLTKAPVYIHIYIMEGYKELPTLIWCHIYFYLNLYISPALFDVQLLLNTCLALQRCVGVKDIKRCQVLGTYKGTTIAILICVLLSFSTNSAFVTLIQIQEIRAISKKILATGEHHYVKTCTFLSRFQYNADNVYSVYQLLEITMMQIYPALVLAVCNFILIQASYRTYIYRKRLVGAVGAIAKSRTSSEADTSSVVGTNLFNSNTQIGPEALPDCTTDCRSATENHVISRISSLTTLTIIDDVDHSEQDSVCKERSTVTCTKQDVLYGNTVKCGVTNVDGTNTKGSKRHIPKLYRNGKITPVRSVNISMSNMSARSICSANSTTRNNHTLLLAQTATDGTHIPTNVSNTTYAHISLINSKPLIGHINSSFTGCEIQAENHLNDNVNTSPKNKSKPRHLTPTDRQTIKQKILRMSSNFTQDTGNKTNDPSSVIIIPEQVAAIDDYHYSFQGGYIPSGDMNESNTTAKACRCSNSKTRASIKRKCNCSNGNRLQQSYMHRISAEVLSIFMLAVVTSCTLIREIILIILLILKYLSSSARPTSGFLSRLDLNIVVTVSIVLQLITFPLNFIFFCGLSQSFRSALKARLSLSIRKCVTSSDQTLSHKKKKQRL